MSKIRPTEISALVFHETVMRRIYLIRGKKVMLDRDLAELYGVLTKVLNQAVKRNMDRFQEDFMFQLTEEETKNWRSQFVTSKNGSLRSQSVTLKRGQHIKYRPFAFTDLGISMLSSVLNSKTAIHVNIRIMRIFSKLKEMLAGNEMLRERIDELESKYKDHDKRLTVVFEAIREILDPPKPKPKREIGFHAK